MYNKESSTEETDVSSEQQHIVSPNTKHIGNLIDNSNEPIHRDAHAFNPPKYVSSQNEPKAEEKQMDPKEDIEAINEEINTETQQKINTRALPQHVKTYKLEKFRKNAMIIFNHEYVDGYSQRKGTIEDERALRETFTKFGFEIEPGRKDLLKVELFSELKKFSEKDFTDYGCVVIVILTHGSNNGLLRAKDEGQLYSEQDIISHFKARSKPTLFTKPVILIIQACRGTSSTQGVAVMQRIRISKDHDEEIKPYYLPVESDMLIVHSSFAGKPSFRPDNGSWFIQTLCKQINELYFTHDLESIFTEVKREIAIEKYYMEHNSATNEMEVNKQMPVVTSTLIRKLFLRKYNDIPPMLLNLVKKPDYTTAADSAPSLSEGQVDSCCCFLDHFGYMKMCLGHIVERNPKDAVAKGLLDIARFESGINDEKAKTTLIAISNYVQKHYKKSEYYKYIYFYDSGYELDGMELEHIENNSTIQRVTKKWSEWSHSNVVRGLGTCVGAFVIYNVVKSLKS